MNTPTHIAAGTLVAQGVIAIAGKWTSRATSVTAGTICFVTAAVSHLVLDAIPHYNWVVYLGWFQGLPFHWLIREAVLALPIVAMAVWCGRDHLIITGSGLFGGMYPDLEKVAYIDFHLPQWLVIFRGHSLQLSEYDGGLPQWLLIMIEAGLVVSMVTATLMLYVRRRAANHE